MPVILSDTFTRADTTAGLVAAETGQLWVPKPSFYYDGIGGPLVTGGTALPLGILSGECYTPEPSESDAPYRAEAAQLNTPDIDASVDVSVRPNAGEAAGFLLRWANQDDFWLAYIYRSIATLTYFVYLDRFDSGAVTQSSAEIGASGLIGFFYLTAQLSGDDIHIIATRSDDMVSFNLNVTDSHCNTATEHGLFAVPRPAGTSRARLDNLLITYEPEPAAEDGWRVGSIGFSG